MNDIFALIGWPLGHSFSEKFFSAHFKADSSGRQYVNCPMPALSAAAVEEMMRRYPSLKGFNVTAPYKLAIMPLLDSLDDSARAVGAVNTVKIIEEGSRKSLRGYNTDVDGVAATLRQFDLAGCRALILGTGGASRAAAEALNRLGVPWTKVSRTPAEGQLAYTGLDRAAVAAHRLIIQCTPVGTFPLADECVPFPFDYLGEGHICFDMVYNPPVTKFLENARARGAATVNGETMLRTQAMAALHIWEDD